MEQCTLTETGAYLTATTISAAYVASLYVLPKRIRQLPRDHPRHIYGPCAAVALSSVFAVALYARVATPGPERFSTSTPIFQTRNLSSRGRGRRRTEATS